MADTYPAPNLYRQILAVAPIDRAQLNADYLRQYPAAGERLFLDGLAVQGDNKVQFGRLEREIRDHVAQLKTAHKKGSSTDAAGELIAVLYYLELLERLYDTDGKKVNALTKLVSDAIDASVIRSLSSDTSRPFEFS